MAEPVAARRTSRFSARFFFCVSACLVLAGWLLPLRAAAQSTGQSMVRGTVTETAAPIGWANVVLFGADGKLAAATVTKEDGGFELAAPDGTYRLRVTFLGFTDWEQSIRVQQVTTVAPIVLRASAATLGEVTVVGRKSLVEYQSDRVVFNVENSLAATGGDAVQAIGAAPGVLVQHNTISILGKGSARVMVDGRLLELSGEELVAYLKTIPAGSIKNVEVLTSPPAKYDASGNGGLININLKQSPANSWKNTIIMAYDQNTYGAYTLRNSLLYGRNKVRVAVSAGGKLGHTRLHQTLDTYYPSGPWELRYTARQREDNASGRAALDYDLTARTSVGVQYAGTGTAAPSSRDYTSIRVFSPDNSLDSLVLNTGARQIRTASHAANAHLVSVLDTLQRKLSLDADYFAYRSDIDNGFAAQSFSPAREVLGTRLAARNVSFQQVRNFSLKADMEHPLQWATLSYGAKVSVVDSRSGGQYYNTLSGRPVLDVSQSNAFDYQEKTQALYGSGTRRFGGQLSLQVGLRLEHTHTRGYSATLNQLTTNDYLKAFPAIHVAYQPTEQHSVQASYSRRLNRPGFGLLNPFRSYINSTSYSEGNPFLQPSFVDNLEAGYTYKSALRTTAFLNRTLNGFGPVFTPNPATNTLVISRQNYFREYSYGLGQSYAASPTAWWQTQTQIYVLSANSRFSREIQAAPRNTAQFYASTSNSFTVSKSTRLQVDYTYNSPFARGLYSMGYTSGLNLSCRQSLFHNRVQMTVLLNDAFNTASLKEYTSTVNGIRQVYGENNSSRFVRLSLTYDFGNSQLQAKTRDFGNDDERKRTN